MKILHSLIILVSIFSLAQGSIFDTLNEFYDGWGEEQCVAINNRRSPQATPLIALEIPFGGFFDGFLDCEHRASNTESFGIDGSPNLIYRIFGYYGILKRKIVYLGQK
ncbi:hypothetical protein B9Z55_003346 [Caenorhabditis nigoni]|uniref:Uncharacterized protein n=1 Tax=Caenorhabditis nigoni TaxID=1611254 RepID=A0A2G5VPU4_9PELO|nr:hypothetical protein B9Z55_003346 [Caenorhabditis nigoni]